MRLVRILGGFNESFVAWVTQPNQDDSQQLVRGLKTEALTARIDMCEECSIFQRPDVTRVRVAYF